MSSNESTYRYINYNLSLLYPDLNEGHFCWFTHEACWCTTIYIIAAIGLLANGTTFLVVLCSRRLRNKSTFTYLLFLAAADNCTLLFQTYECVTFNTMRPNAKALCLFDSIGTYFNDCFLYLSIFYVLAVTIERLIIVKKPLQAPVLCTKKIAVITCISIAAAVVVLNTYDLARCYVDQDIRLSMRDVGNYVYTFGHATISIFLAIVAVLIVWKLRNVNRLRKEMAPSSIGVSSHRRTHALLLATTFTFIILNWPIYGFEIYMSTLEMQGKRIRKDIPNIYLVIREALFLISKTNHCVNFFLYVASAKIFRDEVKHVCCRPVVAAWQERSFASSVGTAKRQKRMAGDVSKSGHDECVHRGSSWTITTSL